MLWCQYLAIVIPWGVVLQIPNICMFCNTTKSYNVTMVTMCCYVLLYEYFVFMIIMEFKKYFSKKIPHKFVCFCFSPEKEVEQGHSRVQQGNRKLAEVSNNRVVITKVSLSVKVCCALVLPRLLS